MVKEDNERSVRKPVPLPRKSLAAKAKNTSLPGFEDKHVEDWTPKESDEKNFVRGNRKSMSESFLFEKKKLLKSEVNKFEATVKNIVSKRKSSSPNSPKKTSSECDKSELSLDSDIFCNISFASPLMDNSNINVDRSNNNCDGNCYSNEFLSPAYSPPKLPDKSVDDEMKCSKLTELQSCTSTSKFNNIYSTVEPDSVKNTVSEDISKDDSSWFYEDTNDNDRYEIIYESVRNDYSKDRYTCLRAKQKISDSELNSDSNSSVLEYDQPKAFQMKYLLHLFNSCEESEKCNNAIPENYMRCKSSSLTNLKIDLPDNKSSEISICWKEKNLVPSNLTENNYGKILKVQEMTNKSAPVFEKKSEPPPIPPRQTPFKKEEKNLNEPKLEILQQASSLCNLAQVSKSTDVIQWSSWKKMARKVADNIEHRTSYFSNPGKKSSKYLNEECPLIDTTKSSNTVGTLFPQQNFLTHSGVMLRPGGVERWGVLSQMKLTLFAHKDSPDVKETVLLDNVLSIQATQNKISGETIGAHCFEISVASKNQMLLFGVPSISERHIWMRKLLESIGPGFPAKLTMDYTKGGWCFVKESITSIWSKYHILLHHRTLYLCSQSGSIVEADLRKARIINLQTEGFLCDSVTEKGPLILIDLQDKTFYLQMDYERETKAWELAITAAALKIGPSLDEQQLTKDGLPVIVEKCLNFIHTHGSLSEGIYRRSGSNRMVSQVLTDLRSNAWPVQFNREECSEFDVSSVLKRFFRDLPEPLIVAEVQKELSKIVDVEDLSTKLEMYKNTVKKLPAINYLTARRLLCHLYFIDKQKDKTLMGSENLAALWGPTILQVQEQVSLHSACFKIETLIVNDLIRYYPEIFDAAQTEVEREMKILQMLENYHTNSTNTLNKRPSGELKIWVYLHSGMNADDCINVSINPQKTSEEVCKEVCFKTHNFVHSSCLEEVICSGSLTRPLHHSEKLLDTVLRWSYWDEADRKDNCLVLTNNDLFQKVARSIQSPVIISEELKFADQKSKTFRSYQIEFNQAKLMCYKDKSCSQKVGEWKIEDIIWYFGHEPKRVPRAKWSITFIEKHSVGPRTKDKPYFGNIICGTSEEQQFRLVTAMLVAQYSTDILPILNLME